MEYGNYVFFVFHLAHFFATRPFPNLANSKQQDVVCPEAVKLDDIDSSAVSSQFDAAKSTFNSAAAGSVEQAQAQIAMDVNRAMGLAIGVSLS